jgi:hypothetical protein
LVKACYNPSVDSKRLFRENEMAVELNDLKALEAILRTLEPLQDEERTRVLRWAIEKLGIEAKVSLRSPLRRDLKSHHPVATAFPEHTDGFQSIGEFVAAANPRTDVDRVLCAALYLQDLAGDEAGRALTGKQINDELKHLGHGVKNITDCINTLKSRKPQHMIQIKKSGKSRQAWKEYRVTTAGHDYVFRLISNGDADEEA